MRCPGHHQEHHDQHHGEHHAEHNDHHGLHEEPSFEPVPNTLIDSRSARQRNRGGDDVALDIGSIAAAGERCIDKVVMVEETEYDDIIECKHSYSQKCHTTYTTDFEPQQEEECEENFKKSCFIEYKKVASEEPIQFCHTPLVCEGEGPEECKTVYESQCETRYHEHDVEDDVVECKTVPRELCGPSGCVLTPGPQECFDKKETIIQEVPEETCNLEPQRQCKHVTKLVPLLKP